MRTVLMRVLITLTCRSRGLSANPAVHLASPSNSFRSGIIARDARGYNVGRSHRLLLKGQLNESGVPLRAPE
jgi:hypothetical protein